MDIVPVTEILVLLWIWMMLTAASTKDEPVDILDPSNRQGLKCILQSFYMHQKFMEADLFWKILSLLEAYFCFAGY